MLVNILPVTFFKGSQKLEMYLRGCVRTSVVKDLLVLSLKDQFLFMQSKTLQKQDSYKWLKHYFRQKYTDTNTLLKINVPK